MVDRLIATKLEPSSDELMVPFSQLMKEYEDGPVTPPDPPVPSLQSVFKEDFEEFKILNGQNKKAAGGWIDSWQRWGVRKLDGNRDQVEKRYIKGSTHLLDQAGLVLRAGYEAGALVGGMISTEALHVQRFGVWEVDLTVMNLPGGYHFWVAMFAADGSWPPEFDLLEMIGGETSPSQLVGHANDHGFMGTAAMSDFPVGHYGELIRLKIDIGPGLVKWFVNDVPVRASKLYLEREMHLQVCFEGGSNWPGPIKDRDAVASVIIHRVEAFRRPNLGESVT